MKNTDVIASMARRQPHATASTLYKCRLHRPLDRHGGLPNNGAVVKASGIGVPKSGGQAATVAAIFSSVDMVPPSMGGPCGAAQAAPDPDPVRQPAWFRPPRLASGQAEVIDRCQEAIMPKILTRILRALFPLQANPVSTLPTQAEARALGALLTSQGKRAVVYQDRGGFTVSEVTSW